MLKKPKDISKTEFYSFKRKALKYRVYKRKLWCLLIKGILIKLVINKKEI
jgi:hypothetical protein